MGIEGHWTGHYVQDFPGARAGGQFAIEAWFEEEGQVLRGRMIDLQTTAESLYSEAVQAEKQSMSWYQRLCSKIYVTLYPGCIFRTTLYPESTLEGTVDGNQVSFTKTYAGLCESAVVNERSEKVVKFQNPRIQYQGTLCDDGNLIQGSYVLPSGRPNPERQTFELRRVVDGAN